MNVFRQADSNFFFLISVVSILIVVYCALISNLISRQTYLCTLVSTLCIFVSFFKGELTYSCTWRWYLAGPRRGRPPGESRTHSRGWRAAGGSGGPCGAARGPETVGCRDFSAGSVVGSTRGSPGRQTWWIWLCEESQEVTQLVMWNSDVFCPHNICFQKPQMELAGFSWVFYSRSWHKSLVKLLLSS